MILLTQDHCILGDAEFCAKSERTQDVQFFELCADYTLQSKLRLGTTAFLKPAYVWQERTKVEDMPIKVAFYLGQFKQGTEQQTIKDWLMTNPALRILYIDC